MILAAIWWSTNCVCVGGGHRYVTKFWRTNLHGVQNLCIVSHLCIQFSAEHRLPEKYKSFFFPIQIEKKNFIKLKGGAYLKYICIFPYSFPSSQATARNSCSFLKLILMKAPHAYFRSFYFQSEYTRPFPSCWNCLWVCWVCLLVSMIYYLNWWMSQFSAKSCVSDTEESLQTSYHAGVK